MPEGELAIAQVVVYLGTASKYDAHRTGYDAAQALAKTTGNVFWTKQGTS